MPEAPFRPLECVIGGSILRVEYCDITTLHVDVMVSSDDIDLSMGGGVSDALLRAGGEAVWHEAKVHAPIKLGDIAITTAGRLHSKKIFHAAVLDYAKRHLTTIDLIRNVTNKCLRVCDASGFRSIAFPALATGAAGLSPERCAVAMMIQTATYLSSSTNIELVVVALYSRIGLPKDVIHRFYSQVSDFIELTQRLESLTTALDNLEKLYRQLKHDETANITALSRESLRRYRSSWEKSISQREPKDFMQEQAWRSYREEIEPDLYRISDLYKRQEWLENFRYQRERFQIWDEYKEYRSAALLEIILIRKKNITDLELELAKKGFDIHINRQLEHQKEELSKLEDELNKLQGDK
ncbi:macro domain-containing protein [Moorena sp. SIO3I6]|uniref:macro domain-containing protein n=1 Tax=Moorena sp. SIO3I6 TaxID=2607831 RepID=UPI0013F7EE36|nr:macro domain-containing protein [Moorena sp. SIO3I6]NEP20825.1 hypothetical protein [Moorena sp. SIO3I6]